MFAREDFARMAAQLAGIRGTSILSISDTPEIREILSGFHLEEVRQSCTDSGTSTEARARELIVSNREARVGPL